MVANPPLKRYRLPLVTLYVTERCNSRCVTCDYWRHGRGDINLESVTDLLPSLKQLGTKLVVLSGGEPLLHPEWASIAQFLKSNGLEVWLLTSGLSLAKHARRAAELFDAVTVSLDGTNPETYEAIRGLDAFDKVCEGIRAAALHGVAPSLRVTLQRSNYRQLPAFVDLAKQIGARQISFLAVDIANPHAFGRLDDYRADLALRHGGFAGSRATHRLFGAGSCGGFSLRFHRGKPAEAQADLAVFRRPLRPRGVSRGALQRTGVFGGDRRHRARAAVLLHSRAARRADLRQRRGGRRRSQEHLKATP